MQLHFTGRNIEITAALKTFTEEKFQKLDRRHANLGNIHVVFHIDHLTHQAEATVSMNGAEIHASAKADDMYAAIDELVDKLVAQITKHKEKISDHR